MLVFNGYAQNSHCTHDFYFDAKIYVNDDYFLNKKIDSTSAAIRAALNGNYQVDDDYVWFDLEGNLGSGNNEDELPFVDENTLAVWFISEGTPFMKSVSLMNSKL